MNWKKYLPIIGIVLFVYILIKINVLSIVSEITKANPLLLIISILLVPLSLTIQTLKWFFIAKKQNISIPFKDAFKIDLISNFYGFVTPSKIGSIVRVGYLKKYSVDIGKGMCNFTLDKILDISSVLFITILFSFIFKYTAVIPIYYLITFFLLMVFLILVFIKKKRSQFLLKFVYRMMIPEKIKEKTKLTFNSFYENMPKKRHFIFFFLLNLMNWIIVYFIAFLIGLSLGIDLSFVHFLSILPIGTLVAFIPITINGLGAKEAVLIGLFSLFGISAAKVFSMSLLFLFITGIIPALIGGVIVFKSKITQ